MDNIARLCCKRWEYKERRKKPKKWNKIQAEWILWVRSERSTCPSEIKVSKYKHGRKYGLLVAKWSASINVEENMDFWWQSEERLRKFYLVVVNVNEGKVMSPTENEGEK